MRTRRLVVAVGALVVLGLASCSGDETTSVPADDDEAGTLTISGSAFVPTSVTAGEDGELTIVNEDDLDHTFTMDDDSLDEEVGAGDTIDVEVTTAGPFHCEIHPSMTGTVSLG